MAYVAVVDIGKTNAKLAVVDVAGRKEVDVRSTANEVLRVAPYPHYDVPRLWEFILSGLKELASLYELSAISITTHGASIVLLDADGELATPVLDYEHTFTDSVNIAYDRLRPPFNLTGSPRLAGGLNAGAQVHWLFNQDPDLHSRTKSIVMYPQYWAYRLCGTLANDPTSLGAHTDLWAADDACFSPIVDALAIREKMANVIKPSEVLGTLRPALEAVTGLSANTPVYCGIHDSNASLFAHLNNLESPFSVVSTGTWVICMAPGSAAQNLDESRDTLLNVNAYGKPVPSSRFMGGREYQYLMDTYAATQTDLIADTVLEKEAFILPAVEPSVGPFQHSAYQWTVDPQTLSPEERYCVISFYLALMTNVCLRLCHAAGPSVIEGPFSRNTLYCTMLAAATDRPVIGTDGVSTGASIGAALLTTAKVEHLPDVHYQSLGGGVVRSDLKAYSDTWHAAIEKHCR